jgi:hypothetical protein
MFAASQLGKMMLVDWMAEDAFPLPIMRYRVISS